MFYPFATLLYSPSSGSPVLFVVTILVSRRHSVSSESPACQSFQEGEVTFLPGLWVSGPEKMKAPLDPTFRSSSAHACLPSRFPDTNQRASLYLIENRAALGHTVV